MFVNLLLTIWYVVLLVINNLLSLIPIQLPANIQTSFLYLGSFIGYTKGIIDVPGVFGAFTFLVQFMAAYFTFKIILMLYHMVVARRVHDSHALPAQKRK